MTCSKSRSKGAMPFLASQPAEDSGVVHIECSDIGPGATTKVLMLDPPGSVRQAGLGDMLAPAGLNAGLFVGGDDKLIRCQGAALPLTGI